MKDEELTRALRGTPPAVDPSHRERLEAELLERFDTRHAGRASRVRRTPTWRQLSLAAALIAIVTATQVPAEYQVEVGKRLTILLPAGAIPPRGIGEAFAQELRAEGGRLINFTVQLRRTPEGPALMIVDAWGDRLADDATVLEQLRAMPELAGADIQVTPHTGQVHDNLISKVGYALFERGASAREREAARQQVIAHLRALAGEGAEVDVQVEDDGTGRRIRARVIQREGEEGPREEGSRP